MMMKALLLVSLLAGLATVPTQAQWGRQTPADTLQSVRVGKDGTVTFSIYAPQAKQVTLGGYVAAENRPAAPVRNEVGVWSISVPGLVPGTYRYHFLVDGQKVLDPKDSEDYERSSLAMVAPEGDEFFVQRNVPHGAMATRYYWSEVLGETRRLHVWTPAGYEKSSEALPVFYLIHGGMESDAFWPTIGRVGEILDNLMAEGKMKPMVVVMPNGSIPMDRIMALLTPEQKAQINSPAFLAAEVPVFTREFVTDIIPFIEQNYRVKTDAENRAIAGLSMGGMETMDILLKHHELFRYAAVLSSGWFEPDRERLKNDGTLARLAPLWNKQFRWLVMTDGGENDMAAVNSEATCRLFDEVGIRYERMQTPYGGHTYITWRKDLYELAQRLFR